MGESSAAGGRSKNRNEVYSVRTEAPATCVFCKKKPHPAYECEVFQKASVQQRYALAKRANLCFNCLAASHQRNSCTSGLCRVCSRKHHTMLHSAATTSMQEPSASCLPREAAAAASSNPTVSSLNHCAQTSLQKQMMVLLPTALVKLVSVDGSVLWARALLDGGSQINIITEVLSQRLGIKRYRDPQTIGGIGMSKNVSTHFMHLPIQSNCSSFSATWKFHVLQNVTWDLPSQAVDISSVRIPEGISMADPQ